MKRDLKLCQEILGRLERDEKVSQTDETYYHLLLLEDAGFVKLVSGHVNYVRERGGDFMPHMARLTWKGHEALARSRRDSYTAELSGDRTLNWIFRVDQP